MVNLILKFVAISRAAGLRVSTSEVLDCLHQLELIDMTDEPQFAAVLRANFAKSRREQFHFDRLYELFFHELRQESNIAHADPLARQIQSTLQELAPQHNENDASQAVLDFLAGDPLPFLERMQLGFLAGDGNGGGPGSNLGPMVQRLELMLQVNAVEDSLTQFLIDQHDRMHWENRRDLKELFKARLDSARRLLTRQPQPFDDDSQITASYQQHLDRLGEIHFASLTKKEVAGMREVIEQLVRKLKDTASRRYAVKNRGGIHAVGGQFLAIGFGCRHQNCALAALERLHVLRHLGLDLRVAVQAVHVGFLGDHGRSCHEKRLVRDQHGPDQHWQSHGPMVGQPRW
ncbi:MAG: hypothetical protein JRF56_02745, partial [Deltaproteobacteria bacterium]|nr:hypothetical protein [Deltaproteobacteria bacterium]